MGISVIFRHFKTSIALIFNEYQDADAKFFLNTRLLCMYKNADLRQLFSFIKKSFYLVKKMEWCNRIKIYGSLIIRLNKEEELFALAANKNNIRSIFSACSRTIIDYMYSNSYVLQSTSYNKSSSLKKIIL